MGRTAIARLLSIGLLLVLVLSACSPAEQASEPQPAPGTPAGDAQPTDPSPADAAPTETGTGGATTAAAGDAPSFAMILSGSTTDGDYNALGRDALDTVGQSFGVETNFSEQIPVGDAARIAREYINDGFGAISLHSGIYLPITLELAAENPDTIFITQGSAELEEELDNVWHIGRRFAYNSSFYTLGYLAGNITETGTVAYLGATEIPDAISGANSFFMGARDANPDVELLHTFTGDFDDPVTARRAADTLIGEGADVIVPFLNAAITGVAEAAEAAPHDTYFTAMYTDKISLSEDRYLMSPIWDFASIFTQIFENIAGGQRSGYIPMGPDTGGVVLDEIHNVPPDLEQELRDLFEEFTTGDRPIPDPSSEAVEVP